MLRHGLRTAGEVQLPDLFQGRAAAARPRCPAPPKPRMPRGSAPAPAAGQSKTCTSKKNSPPAGIVWPSRCAARKTKGRGQSARPLGTCPSDGRPRFEQAAHMRRAPQCRAAASRRRRESRWRSSRRGSAPRRGPGNGSGIGRTRRCSRFCSEWPRRQDRAALLLYNGMAFDSCFPLRDKKGAA